MENEISNVCASLLFLYFENWQNSKANGLNLFTNTKAALHARVKKEYRPKKPVNFKCIEIPIEFRGRKVCGDFFLYSEREIEIIKQEILNNV